MATVVSQETSRFERPRRADTETSVVDTVRAILRPLASLKLTVALFALAVVLVFTGTLAQTRHDVWWVMHNYFHSIVAWIEFNSFFPPAWFSDYPSLVNLKGSFPFPGGFTIGALMTVNLLAAHGLRFKVQTRGLRLWGGLGVIGLGCLLTWLVVAAGPDTDGSQVSAAVDWLTMWRLFLVGIACVCGGIAAALFSIPTERKTERIVLGSVGVVLLGLLAYLLFGIDSQAIDPAAMRILWQLIKAEFAALVLLTGCVLAFRKRAGIVLLHAGVGLIMANVLVVHFLHKEEQMSIVQGRSANYAVDIRSPELAITTTSDEPSSDNVVVFPKALLDESLAEKKAVGDSDFPLEVKVTKYFENAEIVDGKPKEGPAPTAGIGRLQYAVAKKAATGADGDKINFPAAYAEIIDKQSGKSLGTYLLQVFLEPQRVKVGDETYEVSLRFERGYKPYTIHLDEVRGDKYIGTSIPRNFSSAIRIQDPERNVDRRANIRMNEPLRYGGETFYQSNYDDGERAGGVFVAPSTVFQVVSNFGWMIPYVACMIIITGMLAQFILSLTRFLRRQAEPNRLETGFGPRFAANVSAWSPARKFWSALVPIGMIGLFAFFIVTACMPSHKKLDELDLEAAGKIPVLYGGRVQPLDSVARSTLRIISGREVLVNRDETTKPAMVWLMDLIARPDKAAKHRVFRIDNPDVRDLLKLDRHPAKSMFGGSVQRYSPDDFKTNAPAFKKQVEEIAEKYRGKEKQLNTFEKKVMELYERAQIYQAVADAFHLAPEASSEVTEPTPSLYLSTIEQLMEKKGFEGSLPNFPTKDEIRANPEKALEAIRLWLSLDSTYSYDKFIRHQARPPLVIPSPESRESASDTATDAHDPRQWQPYSYAWLDGVSQLMKGGKPNEATAQWQDIIEGYAKGDPKHFNEAVAKYTASLAKDPPRQLSGASPAFEAWFNAAGLFFLAQWFYVVAFCFVGLFWLTGWRPLNWTAIGLLAAIFVVHSFALVARMSISGRPPVTNLYSTALFIGWAGVLLGLILELVYYRLGFGAAIAALIGFGMMLIADKLSLMVNGESRGDTIGVMMAVLDTQFWLATHVTTINIGYATTYIAGLLGLVYVAAGVFTRALTQDVSKLLARMIYGSLCFAMFFSFFGTVLGGLWADDSWGRFWGWDPKENGALIIVLWNALALHARWDGLVKDRGLALLSIGGIIFTSWSYFGVNQLGVGLHSYGFTEGVLMWLGIVCATMLGMIALGAMPVRWWMSGRTLEAKTA